MGRWLLALSEDEIVEWSSIVDAPVSYIEDRAHAERKWGTERVARAIDNVTSIIEGPSYGTVRDVIGGNRAGAHESELTLDELRATYGRPVIPVSESTTERSET